ncbi:hypothetical protein VOI32_36700 [Paraburkholderia caribensis]|uniref:Uncharacterized protein n=1 Tax=Paraburkholderia caribensis TaxID=75105 RepID=A0ABV0E7M5_9BURK|nr:MULTISPECIES: hypothetical protein [Paraburkholderia]MCO4881979.1 hypothetical protein [Paraburkholderia caribensis]
MIKHAVEVLTKRTAIELANSGTGVNAVSRILIEVPLTQKSFEISDFHEW